MLEISFPYPEFRNYLRLPVLMGQAGTWSLVFYDQQDTTMATVSHATIFDFPNLMSRS